MAMLCGDASVLDRMADPRVLAALQPECAFAFSSRLCAAPPPGPRSLFFAAHGGGHLSEIVWRHWEPLRRGSPTGRLPRHGAGGAPSRRRARARVRHEWDGRSARGGGSHH
ncbi:uncharacterized protein Tco025E_08833 [Trypanosoma conorhini]|uniref:Uncharacterized protein n=1 Tax=Trypanosoma conorhini TaxID=83891 RepID=A0A422N495_9TRYP|nr:uncharacterized protein Tco025E_08833 [Trypanosoma conorhini]RNF00297.1 hypothetical protein Tco025E_08833 [Trypanosoma conorhini]